MGNRDQLAKGRTYLNSGDPDFRDDIKRQDYHVIETTPEKAIRYCYYCFEWD